MNTDTTLFFTNILYFLVTMPWSIVILYGLLLTCIVYIGCYLIKKYQRLSKIDIYEQYENIYHVSNIVSVNEISTVKKQSILVELDTVAEENTGTPLALYTILKLDDSKLSYDIIHNNQHTKFLSAYRNQRWDMAMTIGNSLKTSYNGCLRQYYSTMISRCQYYKKNPPGKNWDGIWLQE